MIKRRAELFPGRGVTRGVWSGHDFIRSSSWQEPRETVPSPKYKSYLDSQYTANQASFDSLASSGNGDVYYGFEYALMGWTAAYEATGDATYIARVLGYGETMIAAASTSLDSCHHLMWQGGPSIGNMNGNTINGCTFTNAAPPGSEYVAAMELARVVMLIKTNPALDAVYGARANTMRSWLHTNIVLKWGVDFLQLSQWLQFPYADTNKLILNILINLDQAGLANTVISGGTTYRSLIIAMLNLYVTVVSAPFGDGSEIADYHAYPSPSSECPNGSAGPCDHDTSHFGRWPHMLQHAVDAGFSPLVNPTPVPTTLAQHVAGLERLLSLHIWNRSTTSPQFTNFIDGNNGTYRGQGPWVNGNLAAGWGYVAHHHIDGVTAMTALLDCVIAGCSSPSRPINSGDASIRTALAGTTMLAQVRRTMGT